MTAAKNIASGHLLIAIAEIHNLIFRLADNKLAIDCDSMADLAHAEKHAQQALKLVETQQFAQALPEVQEALTHYYEIPATLSPAPESLIAAKIAIGLELKGRRLEALEMKGL